jgi:hypothetical protein
VAKKLRAMEESGATLAARGAKIRLGLATGLNEAFLLTTDAAHELVLQDRRSAQVVRPVLRGRDIARWRYTLPDLRLLLLPTGTNVERDYPAVLNHLRRFEDALRARGAKGSHWTTMRPCAFLADFARPKIVWIELAERGRFAICAEEVYLLNTAYYLLPPPGLDLRFLLAVLNSEPVSWYARFVGQTSGMGTTRWINRLVARIPIPDATRHQQATLADLAQRCIDAGGVGCEEWEREIDERVAALYGL